MHIGHVAKLTGASPKAIRLYEQLQLLPSVRRQGSYRVYTEEDVQLIRWIRQAQELGFKLAELSALLGALEAPDWPAVAAAVAAKRARVQAELAALTQLETRLGQLAEELAGCSLANDAGLAGADCNLNA